MDGWPSDVCRASQEKVQGLPSEIAKPGNLDRQQENEQRLHAHDGGPRGKFPCHANSDGPVERAGGTDASLVILAWLK